MNYRSEIDRLFRIEYGNAWEVLLRFLGVTAGGFLLMAYNNDDMGLVWAGIFLASHLAFYFYHARLGAEVSWRQCATCYCLNLGIVAAFLWFPAYLMLQGDRTMIFIGASLIGCVLVYLLQRGETALFMVVGCVVVFFGISAVVLIYLAFHADDLVALLGLSLAWFALQGYFAQSLVWARQRKLATAEAMEQAAQAQKMSAIGQLAGGVAHDFNNILTAISGNLELHAVLRSEEEKRAVLEEARQATERAARTVRQLLIFARRSPLEVEVIEANKALREVAPLMAHLVPANVRVRVVPMVPPTSVRVDENQLVTAIVNLVVNSVDALPEGGNIRIGVEEVALLGRKTVAGGHVLPPGDYVVYAVSDDGPGIPARLTQKVLEPFYTSKEVGKGTGLGLSMVLSIAEGAGGGIEIASSRSGTTVRIYIPKFTYPADVAPSFP